MRLCLKVKGPSELLQADAAFTSDRIWSVPLRGALNRSDHVIEQGR